MFETVDDLSLAADLANLLISRRVDFSVRYDSRGNCLFQANSADGLFLIQRAIRTLGQISQILSQSE